jgi:ATP-dependent helicase/nuclease subunit B
MSAHAAHRALFGGPHWFTIAAHRPFLDDLAFALDAALSPLGPEALADAMVLTPTRRAARALAEAFVRTGAGQAVLLPQIRAIGDLDEGEPPFEPGDLILDLPPAISTTRRRFELARLVVAHEHLFARSLNVTAALELGDALAGFLDSVQIEEVDEIARIDTLVEGDLARHWRASADFLKIATTAWPARLRELGLADVTARRTALLRALADQWRDSPPDRPLIAAGSTGTAPATADLLRVIAAAPQGCVVLPGLDLDLAETAWAEVGEAHPQGAMRRLLARAGLTREDVRPWPAPESVAAQVRGRARRRVVNEALRPAETTSDWVRVIAALREEGARDGVDPISEGLKGLSMATARTEEEAATMIALLLRETLETPNRTAALVTPDAALARRVSARLARWGVRVDSSAGAPLAQVSAGQLVSLVAQATAEPLAPAILLGVLKHPRVHLGRSEETLSVQSRLLERYGLRGARPRSWDELSDRLRLERLQGRAEPAIPLAVDLSTALEIASAPFATGPASAVDAARALTRALEALATDAHDRSAALWDGADGEAAAELLASLIEDGAALPPCTAGGFAQLIEILLASQVVRTGGANHPRLRILGAIEARLIRADRLILAGLEEGVWPRATEVDPFLSRPMRAKLSLPPPERRTGLAAHDFAQAACAPDVVLINTERRGGQPAVMSRWLWRLEILARGAAIALPRRDEVADWARALDAPIPIPPKYLSPADRPNPKPPLAVRPTQLPVTGVETWIRDPYAVYARRILGLRQLERPDAPVEARARGTAIHAAFERFAREHPDVLPTEAEALFQAWLADELEKAGMPPPRMARERALARRLAAWSMAFERRRRQGGARLLIEQQGTLVFPVDGENFTVTAKADRMEVHDGVADVIDFKTGQPPSKDEVRGGFAPQLSLTGAIIARGGFADLGVIAPGELLYVRVSGGRKPGEEKSIANALESPAISDRALAGLEARVRLFRDPERGYLAKAAPKFIDDVSDYDQLSRQWEWHVMGEAEAGDGA